MSGAGHDLGLVYIDEEGITLWTHRTYAWKNKGVTPVAHVPGDRTRKVNCIAASSQVFGGVCFEMHLETLGKKEFTAFVLRAADDWNKLMRMREAHLPPVEKVTLTFDNSSIHCKKDLEEALRLHNQKLAMACQ